MTPSHAMYAIRMLETYVIGSVCVITRGDPVCLCLPLQASKLRSFVDKASPLLLQISGIEDMGLESTDMVIAELTPMVGALQHLFDQCKP